MTMLYEKYIVVWRTLNKQGLMSAFFCTQEEATARLDNFREEGREAALFLFPLDSPTKEMIHGLLDALYEVYPDGSSSMPDNLSEAVINMLKALDGNE